MSRNDRLVYQIVLSLHPSKDLIKEQMPRVQAEIEDNEDDFMVDGTISPLEIKANYTKYKGSLSRFRISAEQFFSLLRERNSKLEECYGEDEEK